MTTRKQINCANENCADHPIPVPEGAPKVFELRPYEFVEDVLSMVKRTWSSNFASLLTRIQELHNRKKADYTGGKSPLYNYEQAARVCLTTTHRIMLARVQEKVTRLENLLAVTNAGVDAKPRVKDERIEDTLMDIANIALLILNDLEVNNEN